METNALVDYVLQLYHFPKFFVAAPRVVLEKGMLVISIDLDVGNKELGLVNQGKNDLNVNDHLSEFSVGAIEELALPMFLDLFEKFDHPVTFAVRGQWIDNPNPVLDRLLSASVKHDIAAHGYSHRRFDALPPEKAHAELKETSEALRRRCKKSPSSFVFPRNIVAHLDLLPMYGFRSYRGYAGTLRDGLYIANHGLLWDVHPSLHISDGTPYFLTKKILDLCLDRKLPFHIWFHLWNYGNTKHSIEKKITGYFQPLLNYARLKMLDGTLDIETMSSAVEGKRVSE
jgi:peptidoglycan/xylan/chitin deacetylase (PgdA/CDA1 family)